MTHHRHQMVQAVMDLSVAAEIVVAAEEEKATVVAAAAAVEEATLVPLAVQEVTLEILVTSEQEMVLALVQMTKPAAHLRAPLHLLPPKQKESLQV